MDSTPTRPRWRALLSLIAAALGGILFTALTLWLSTQPGNPSAFSTLLSDWMHASVWTGPSINFDYGGPRNAHFPPVLLMALWASFATLCYALLNPPWRGFKSLAPYAVIWLIGWLALDVRWQWVLGQRLTQTHALYAGLDDEARQLAGPDRNLYPFLREVRGLLAGASASAKVFIVSSNANGYAAGRARYHLLPHNAYISDPSFPHAKQMRPGDYILALRPLPRFAYDRKQRVLLLKGSRLPAERLHDDPGQGALFRIIGGL